ncbi:MAG TPA: hypothetical protein VJN42_09380 [Candidatus Acidoferrum sp.]|nr:hypothetical protein [Candidatus Acidoferrum sp.]
MPYDFEPWEDDLQPHPAGSRGAVPPRKFVGIGVLDPPAPPKRTPQPLAAPLLVRVLAGLLLAALALATLFLLFRPR